MHIDKNLTIHPLAPKDIPTLADLLKACSLHESGETFQDDGRLAAIFGSDQMDTTRDTWGIFAETGEMIGWGAVISAPPHVKIRAIANVHPAWMGQGIGSHLLHLMEERAREKVAEAPEGTRVGVHQIVKADYAPAVELLKAHGYRTLRYFLRMVIELDGSIPDPVWPEGITARAYQPGDERAVYVAVEEAFSDHWGHVPVPEEEGLRRIRKRIAAPDFDPALWILAEDAGEIAGFAICRPQMPTDPESGYVDMLGVRRAWRRQGIALAMLHRAFHLFEERGQKRVRLGVDAENLTGATRLYTKAGMRADERERLFEKELRPGRNLAKQD
jgi:mycothiol synthase